MNDKSNQPDHLFSNEIIPNDKINLSTQKLSYDLIPSNLQNIIDQASWNSFSLFRQKSFSHIYENPNTFFYRNRPPGDIEKVGPFSLEEEKLFFSRLHYFHDVLHLHGFWGLFAIPFHGRFGYQCCNFYRFLIRNGKISDFHYDLQEDGNLLYIPPKEKPNHEAIKILEREAFHYITKCANKIEESHIPLSHQRYSQNDGSKKPPPLQNTTPVLPETTPFPDSSDSEPNDSDESSSPPDNEGFSRQSMKSPRQSPSPTIFEDQNNPTIAQKPKISYQENNKGKIIEKEKKLLNAKKTSNKFKNINDKNIVLSIFMVDPLTKEAMKFPYMDPISKVIMDLSTWNLVFKNEISNPYRVYAESKEDLIPMFQKKSIDLS